MDCKNTAFSSHHRINCRRKVVKIDRPLIMGILNLTPDSFYDGGFYNEVPDIIERVENMITQGADIIDVGAVSTRPGSTAVSVQQEEDRLFPVLEMIRKRYDDVIISVDTFRSGIARQAVEMGADMINDISAGILDENMFRTIASLQVPYVMMHMQGQPAGMQINPVYSNVVSEVYRFFDERLAMISKEGIHDIIIDPGFGFGKTVQHNYELLSHLDEFLTFNRPIMAGLSRKSLINHVLGIKPAGALNGTTVLNTIAILKGAHLLRVHDVKEATEVVNLCRQYILNPE